MIFKFIKSQPPTIRFQAALHWWIAVLPILITGLNSDTIKQYVPPLAIWAITLLITAMNTGLIQMKSFFSTTFADHKGQTPPPETPPIPSAKISAD